MFGELFNTVFPALGEFFGILAGVANIKPSAFLTFLNYVAENPDASPILFSVSYFNVFTGISGVNSDLVHYAFNISSEFFQTNIFGRLINVVGSPFITAFFGVFVDFPLWLSLPCAFAMWGWIIAVVKFFWNIIVP